jgi:two-component system, LytTR family, sensor kinase
MNQWQHKAMQYILRQLRDIMLILAISTVVTYFYVGNELFRNFSAFLHNNLYGFSIGISLWKGNTLISRTVTSKYPWKIKPSKTLTIDILFSVTYTALAIIAINVLFYKYFFKVSIAANFKQIIIEIIIEMAIAWLITSIYLTRNFFIHYRDAIVREEGYNREALSLQYETLKSYVNPHFLFNSLSVLSSLVEKDAAKSQLFIRQLSDIYRYVLDQKDKELVPLETELEFAQSYINLHKIRHSDNLQVEINVPNRAGYIVPLSMQILLENAFKHNIISEEDPLEVKIWRDGNYMVIRNKLQVRKVIKASPGTGLVTIVKRYEFLTSKPVGIVDDDGFYTVEIPILDSDKMAIK